jgi:hypothetical protein
LADAKLFVRDARAVAQFRSDISFLPRVASAPQNLIEKTCVLENSHRNQSSSGAQPRPATHKPSQIRDAEFTLSNFETTAAHGRTNI